MLLDTLGVDVNQADLAGEAPLHAACLGGHEGTVLLLLRSAASVNLPQPDGTTPLLLACLAGHAGLAQALLQHGADAAHARHDGKAALQLAEEAVRQSRLHPRRCTARRRRPRHTRERAPHRLSPC